MFGGYLWHPVPLSRRSTYLAQTDAVSMSPTSYVEDDQAENHQGDYDAEYCEGPVLQNKKPRTGGRNGASWSLERDGLGTQGRVQVNSNISGE